MKTMGAIETIVWVLVSVLSGEFPVSDIVYSVESLFQTGEILEDSIFWNCETMGNKVCG